VSDVTEDLQILYRAVSRRQGRSIDYAGCVTAQEALRLKQMGLAKIVDLDGLPDPEGDDATPALVDSLHRLAGNNDILMFVSRNPGASHAAATMAAQAGFYCVLNVIDGHECLPKCSHASSREDPATAAP